MKEKLTHVVKMVFLALIVFSLVPVLFAQATCSVEPWTTDIATKGDWYFNPIGSPIGVYGGCAYILPNPPVNLVEIPIGQFSYPIGFDVGDPSTWSQLGDSPYNWTSSQIGGLNWYKPDPNYWDEFYSIIPGTPGFSYSVEGTKICMDDPRALTDGTNRKAACYFAGSSPAPSAIDVTLNLLAGSYQLSMYLIDWDTNSRAEVAAVSSDGAYDYIDVINFQNGVYVNFFVHLPTNQAVTLEVTKDVGTINSVISGIFLCSTAQIPIDPNVTEIGYIGDDWATQGNWIGVYGNLGSILCGWNAPTIKTNYPWNSSYDLAAGALLGAYSVDGYVWAWTDILPGCIQYPVFEWGWSDFTATQIGPRQVYYPQQQAWRYACWDDGNERCKPVNGYENFKLYFPEGIYMLSLYAYDYELTPRTTMEYRIYDETGINLLASKQVQEADLDGGVFEIFKVTAPPEGCTIIVQVYNDAGHPSPTLNVLLSGIFVDCLKQTQELCGHTIGFWKTNASKDLGLQRKAYAQVTYLEYLSLLSCVNTNYGPQIGDWSEWGIGGTIDRADLEWALHWLSYGAWNPVTHKWVIPDANDMQTKARGQLLSLLLTKCWYNAQGLPYADAKITIPCHADLGALTISQWINILFWLYNDGIPDVSWDLVYQHVELIADYINNHCAIYNGGIDP